MTTLKLQPHGAYVNPFYRPPEGVEAKPPAPETKKEGATVDGLVRRFDKHTSAHRNPRTMGWVKATYGDAIEYTRTGVGHRGMGFFWVCFVILGPGALCIYALPTFIDPQDWLGYVVVALLFVLLFVFLIYFPVWLTRLEMFRPEDEPVIFDRRHRKVYRITREIAPGIKGLFEPWPMVALEYDWDLIDVEHHVDTAVSPNMVKRQHALVFVVKRSADDPTIIDSFDLGNRMVYDDGLLACVWEHIRRFMEEGGPHLPWGEPLAEPREPKSIREGIAQVAPLQGRSFWQWIREEPIYAAFLCSIALPAYLPMLLLWGTGNYLAYRTSIPIRWPDAVREAVGAPIASSVGGTGSPPS